MTRFTFSPTAQDRFRLLQWLVEQWNPKINLVAPASIPGIWERHIMDSAQLFHVKQDWGAHYVDLGSGGGFPGLVCAAVLAEHQPDTAITFVESDARKCVFLRTALRQMSVKATVVTARIEAVTPMKASTLTARALAPLDRLLAFAEKHGAEETTCLFPKGARWQEEVESAYKSWSFDLVAHPSETQAEARILEIGRISRV